MKFRSKEIGFLLVFCIGFTTAFYLDEAEKETGGRSRRILNGTNVKLGQFPYVVEVREPHGDGTYGLCTGSLISELSALTAQHCISQRHQTKNKTIFTEAYTLYFGYVKYGQSRRSATVRVVHLPESSLNDIAILNLKEPVQLNEFIKTVAVSEGPFYYKEGTPVYSIGWGESHDRVKTLNYQQMKIVEIEKCDIYGRHLPTTICTEHLVEGICSGGGDSGGPLVIKRPEGDLLVAVYSANAVYDCEIHPEMFTSTSWSANWIRKYAEGNVTFVDITFENWEF